MEISEMLQYQQLDMEMMKLENEFKASDAAKEYTANRHAINSAKEIVLKQNKDAGDLVVQMETLIAQYDALEKELKESESAANDVQDINGADFFIRNVQKLITQLQNIARDVSKLSTRIVEINKQSADAVAQGKKATANSAACTAAFEAEKNRITPRVMELKSGIEQFEKNCKETKFIEVYKRLRQAKTLPPIVPLKNGASCGGCFMELAADALGKLTADNNHIECPNCGRILYKA